jgi:hypothetical protein
MGTLRGWLTGLEPATAWTTILRIGLSWLELCLPERI